MSSFSAWRSDYRLRPSRRERQLRWLLICLCLAALPASQMPWYWLLPAGLLAVLQAWHFWRRPGGSREISGLQLTPLGWRLTLANGDVAFADVTGPVRDWSGLLCFQCRELPAEVMPGGLPRQWRIVLWRDQLAATDWRRLRVSLRWRRRASAGAPRPP